MTERHPPRLPAARRGPQWPLLIVLSAGIVAIAALWFALTDPLGDSGGDEPQRYVEAVVGAPARINPLFAHLNDADRDLSTLIFSGLTRLGPTGEILPDLAQSWEVSEDGRTYTFNLRPGVRWHTGESFTAEDVLFTLRLLADPEVPADPTLSQLWRQVECEGPDPLTVVCRLPSPFSPFLAYTTVGILPRHALEGTEPAELFDSPFNQAPVGTGPYRLVQMDQTRAILTANEGYYLGPPQIDEVELRFYPDFATAAAALSRGEVQGLLLSPAAGPSEFDLLASTEGLRAYTATGTAATILYLNNERPPFDDRRVRQAVARAVDMDAIIGRLLPGRAIRGTSPIVPGTWAANPDLPPHERDLGQARRLLTEAGWQRAEEGPRIKDGVLLTITLMTDEDPLRGAIAEEIAGQLQEVGFQVTVVRQSATKLIQDFLIPRQYQAAIFGWEPDPDPDPYPAWHSSQVSEGGRNIAGYISDEADRVLEEARRTVDLDKRQALYYTFQQIFYEDVPSLPLYYPVYTYFVREEVEGIQMGTLFHTGSRFANIHEWSIGDRAEILGP